MTPLLATGPLTGITLSYIGTLIGTLIAIVIAMRAERHSSNASLRADAVEAIARADKARTEYVELLEGRVNLLEGQLEDYTRQVKSALTDIAGLKFAEENCQKERVILLGESNNLRRQLERLQSQATGMDG